MGVLGLWQLLAPVGQPVTVESLENKIFAVDVSIWLNQALKGYRDSQGGSVTNAHLLSLFSRLCKLLFYKIRPIIVFDGGFPELKRQTIINRQQRRAAVKQHSRDIGLKVLTNYLASQQLGENSNSSNYVKGMFKTKEKPRDEIFKLPPLPEDSIDTLSDSFENEEDYGRKFTSFSREDIKYLNQIDIDSEDFNVLPPDVKQEILSTLKESRKHRTWDQYDELPKESNEFSNYQMQCLLKRRKLQNKLEQVQKDIRQINSSAYVSQYTSDHVIGETNKIMSDDVSYYVLLKKFTDKNDIDSKKAGTMPSSSVMSDTKSAFLRDVENIDIDEDSLNLSTYNQNKKADQLHNEIIKKHSLNISDEEYDVDNPPEQGDGCNFEENIIKGCSQEVKLNSASNLNESVIHNTSDHQNFIELYDNTLQLKTFSNEGDILEPKCNLNNSGVFISSQKQESFKTEDASCITVTVSDDDEMIACNEAINIIDIKYNGNKYDDKIDLSDNALDSQYKSENVNTSVSDETFSELYMSDPISTSSLKPQSSYLRDTEISINTHVSEENRELQTNLNEAATILEAEQAKQDRQSNTVQDHMIDECKELLKLFGIPFIVSPLEAEAQCAFFDKIGLTHGTITDDSDVWLFGGKRVYKNFFSQQKFVESYKDKEIFTHFGLSRPKLINFALLTGSDYTEGIEGVGPVTAMEIISEFPGDDIDSLIRFKEWWENSNKHARPPENKVRTKLLKLILPQTFPEYKVFDAYINPEVDNSTEKFTWGRPDLDALREYTREKFGWNQNKVDDALLPVLKKLNERDKQTHLDSFFTVTLKKETNLFPSKRIMSALKKITSPEKQVTETSTELKAVKRKSSKLPSRKKMPKIATKKISNAKNNKIQNHGPILSEESSSDSNN